MKKEQVTTETELKISELHIAKIKEVQNKDIENSRLASELCAKEFELTKLEAILNSEKEKWSDSKSKLVAAYEEISTLNEKLHKELKDMYGEIQITNLETGEYIINS